MLLKTLIGIGNNEIMIRMRNEMMMTKIIGFSSGNFRKEGTTKKYKDIM